MTEQDIEDFLDMIDMQLVPQSGRFFVDKIGDIWEIKNGKATRYVSRKNSSPMSQSSD